MTLTNRTEERATKLAEELGCRTAAWTMTGPSLIPDIMINCTPVGMHPNVDDTPMPPPAGFRPGMVVMDTVYHPENTMFLKLARERECKTVSGVDMFLRQAAIQFAALHRPGTAPMDEMMRDVVRRKLGDPGLR